MRLILIRHGKATYKANSDGTLACMLLPEGRVQLAQDFPFLKDHFLPEGQVHIWHSPKNRAKETAEMLKDCCGLKETPLQCDEDILEGNLLGFFRKIKDTPPQDTVVVVGHDPTMSIWLRKIAEENKMFSKGSAAVVDLSRISPPTGKMKCFFHPQLFFSPEKPMKLSISSEKDDIPQDPSSDPSSPPDGSLRSRIRSFFGIKP